MFIPTSYQAKVTLGPNTSPIPQQHADMKLSKVIQYQYQAGMKVLNTEPHWYVKRAILVQHWL